MTFMQQYNDYAKKRNMDKISPFKIDRFLKERFGNDKSNMYDKIIVLFPTIEKYIYDNMFLIFLDSEQKPIDKNKKCSFCNHTFEISKVATLNNGKIVHKSCTISNKPNEIKNSMKMLFESNNICGLCNEQINDVPIMCDDNFFHKSCSIDATVNSYNHLKCYMCTKPILKEKNLIVYCTRHDKTLHISCANECERSIKFKKVKVNLSLTKCCVCGFYTPDNKTIHTKCYNKLKDI